MKTPVGSSTNAFLKEGPANSWQPLACGCKPWKAWGWGKGTCSGSVGAWLLWDASFVELAEVTISEKASGGHRWRLKEPQAQIWDVTESLKPSWQRCLLHQGKRIHFHILLPWTPTSCLYIPGRGYLLLTWGSTPGLGRVDLEGAVKDGGVCVGVGGGGVWTNSPWRGSSF